MSHPLSTLNFRKRCLMTNGKTESIIDRACLISYFIILVAFKENASWADQPRAHTLLWNASNLVAKGVLIVALSASTLGVLIVVGRIIRFLLSKPRWRSSLAQFKKHLKAPYEPEPWMNIAYGFLGVLMFGNPFFELVIGMILAMFFSVTVRITLTKPSVQKMIGFVS